MIKKRFCSLLEGADWTPWLDMLNCRTFRGRVLRHSSNNPGCLFWSGRFDLPPSESWLLQFWKSSFFILVILHKSVGFLQSVCSVLVLVPVFVFVFVFVFVNLQTPFSSSLCTRVLVFCWLPIWDGQLSESAAISSTWSSTSSPSLGSSSSTPPSTPSSSSSSLCLMIAYLRRAAVRVCRRIE